MLNLAIDTSSDNSSLAILNDNNIIGCRSYITQFKASSDLITELDDFLLDNKIKLAEIEIISVSTGPGSFTGVRVGMATALGLAKGFEKSVYGVDQMAAMAASLGKDGLISVIIKVGPFYYVRTYSVKNNESPVEVLPRTNVAKVRNGEISHQISESDAVTVDEKTFDSFQQNISKNLFAVGNNLAEFIGKLGYAQSLSQNKTAPKPVYLDSHV